MTDAPGIAGKSFKLCTNGRKDFCVCFADTFTYIFIDDHYTADRRQW
jgi:hypothetical protein